MDKTQARGLLTDTDSQALLLSTNQTLRMERERECGVCVCVVCVCVSPVWNKTHILIQGEAARHLQLEGRTPPCLQGAPSSKAAASGELLL